MGVDARACDLGANGRAERGGKERKGRGGGRWEGHSCVLYNKEVCLCA